MSEGTNEHRAAVPQAGLRDLILWVARRRQRWAVVGPSMEPSLRAGQIVFTEPVPADEIQPGDIVVARHPRTTDLPIVKRVHAFDESGWLHLWSDNLAAPGAQDSRVFGPLAPEFLLGRVVAALTPPSSG